MIATPDGLLEISKSPTFRYTAHSYFRVLALEIVDQWLDLESKGGVKEIMTKLTELQKTKTSMSACFEIVDAMIQASSRVKFEGSNGEVDWNVYLRSLMKPSDGIFK